MKKMLGKWLSWTLYFLGDWVSQAMNALDADWLYPLYNKLMILSVDIQDWAQCDGPWHDCEEVY